MKQLTEQAVQTMMDLLIHTNRSTTTLDVKNELRNLGYFAEQSTVHEMVENIFDNTVGFTRDNSSTSYYVYGWTVAHEMAIGGYADEQGDDTDSDDTDSNRANDNTASTALKNAKANFTAQLTGNTTPVATGSRDPQYIYYVESHAQNHQADKNTWVAFHTNGNNEIHMYDGGLTRDQIRSRYASLLNVKIQDVRSKRLSNYTK